MRLIDLDELLKFPIRLDTYDKKNGNKHFVFGIESVLEYAENLPTVDAVDRELYEQCKFDKDIAEEQLKKIVRCKDCIDWDTSWTPIGTEQSKEEMHFCAVTGIILPENHFCSYGERKTE